MNPEPVALNSRSVLHKAAWRLVPFLCVLYFFNILDRTNVGFARLTMQADLRMGDGVYEWGYGIFYFGYLLFEVPANLLLRRIGARRWMARIMITWGIVSCATLAVTGPISFYGVRILLGIAEAGFFPGIIVYLTYWFPAHARAKMTAFFMMAISVSGMIGNPLSGAVMQYLHGLGGLKGWQWLFLVEGLPSIILGIATLYYLPDGPEQAPWLSHGERARLAEQLRADSTPQQSHQSDLLRALTSGRVWLLIIMYSSVAITANASGAHFPKLIQNLFPGRDKFEIGLLSAAPHLCALIGMTVWAASSDRTGERRKHVAFAAFVAAAGWLLSMASASPWVSLAGLCLAQMGMMSMLPTFWAIPPSFLRGVAAAGGIALINSVANIGGLLGPSILGRSGANGPIVMATILLGGSVLALIIRHDREPKKT